MHGRQDAGCNAGGYLAPDQPGLRRSHCLLSGFDLECHTLNLVNDLESLSYLAMRKSSRVAKSTSSRMAK
jgi:hypothetical protein